MQISLNEEQLRIIKEGGMQISLNEEQRKYLLKLLDKDRDGTQVSAEQLHDIYMIRAQLEFPDLMIIHKRTRQVSHGGFVDAVDALELDQYEVAAALEEHGRVDTKDVTVTFWDPNREGKSEN